MTNQIEENMSAKTGPQLAMVYNDLVKRGQLLGMKELVPVKLFHDKAKAMKQIDALGAKLATAFGDKKPDKDMPGIPDFLLVKNRQPLTVEQQDRLKTINGRVHAAKRDKTNWSKPQTWTPEAEALLKQQEIAQMKNGYPDTPYFWSTKVTLPTPSVEEALAQGRIKAGTTQEQWEALSPGMRREIMKARVNALHKSKEPAPVMSRKPRKARTPSANGGISKTMLIAGLLTRAGGCTTKDILEATGWPAVSVPAMAKAAKLTLVKTKVDGVTRYTA
jgi:hypothetical protein